MSAAELAVPWVNATGEESYDDNPQLNQYLDRVGREIAGWVTDVQSRGRRAGSLVNRASYIPPESPFEQMRVAKQAVGSDDVVGGIADVTEGLIFQGLKWESDDAEAADIFNQISRDLDLDSFARSWYREDYSVSQAYVGLWWANQAYKLRGQTTTGKKTKKSKVVYAPVAWTFLDPLKVVPLKPGPFGQDRLAWYASKEEMADYEAARDGGLLDPVLREFTAGKAQINSLSERDQLQEWGIDYRQLLLLNPARVFRICRTKAPYERFPDIRLKSVFPLLDLKQQLIEKDRVALVGSANFILLVRLGDKDRPAQQPEIDNLNEKFKVVAKLPVVVGDDRLQIDIVTPDQEFVLDGEKYDTLDRRILSRTLGALTVASSGQRNESTLTVARGVARLLETRRHTMKRAMERELARAIVDHPLNARVFDAEPNLTFTPRNVQIDSDADVIRAIMSLRSSNDLSRESTLEYLGFDQAVEALRRQFEEENYDEIFKTQVPFSAAEPPQVTGAQGGRPAGGGDSPQSPQGQAGGRSPSGQKTPS